MKKTFKIILLLIIAMAIPLSAHAILLMETWKLTLTTAGTAQTINSSSFPSIRYVPAYRVYNLSPISGTNNVYVGSSTVSSANAEPLSPSRGVALSNEQTTGQNEKMFDLQQIYFDADTNATEVIITVIYDDGN